MSMPQCAGKKNIVCVLFVIAGARLPAGQAFEAAPKFAETLPPGELRSESFLQYLVRKTLMLKEEGSLFRYAALFARRNNIGGV